MNKPGIGIALGIILTLPSMAMSTVCTSCTLASIASGPSYDALCTSGKCVFVDVGTPAPGRPGCSTNSQWEYALDLNTDSGKATYALLLTAYISGKPVTIQGSGGCALSAAGQVENLSSAEFAP
jgi:hypothetical protein